MYEYCKDLHQRTVIAMEMVNRDLKKRKEKEGVEDFIRRIECISAGYSDLHAYSSGVEETCFEGDKLMTNFEGFGDS